MKMYNISTYYCYSSIQSFFIYILILRFVLYSVFLRIGVAWQTEVWAEVDISLPEFAWHLNVITQLLSP